MDVFVNQLLEDPNINTVSLIFTQLDGQIQEKKNTIDLIFGKTLLIIIKTSQTQIPSKAIDLCILSILVVESLNASSTNLPFVLISDLLDLMPISTCETIISLINQNLPKFLQEPLYSAGKYILLRSFNDLLRRLSQIRDHQLCGEIQFLLSRMFPLNEKSALNLTSDFNTDKLSLILPPELHNNENPSHDNTLTDDFFNKFWAIQDCLNDPNLIFLSPGTWDKFSQDIDFILQSFHNVESSSIINSIDTITANIEFIAKYTANPRLITYQMNDLNFRHQILLQFYIIIDYLRSKGKYQIHQLSLSQHQWCNDTLDRINIIFHKYDTIYQCDFRQFVKNIIGNEEMWSDWKNRGCPPFNIIDAQNNTPLIDSSLNLEDWNFYEQKMFTSQRLNELWSICQDNMEACKICPTPLLYPSNTVQSLFSSFSVNIADTSDINKVISNPSMMWRVLRLMASNYPEFFSPTNNQPSLAAFVEGFIVQHVKSENQQS